MRKQPSTRNKTGRGRKNTPEPQPETGQGVLKAAEDENHHMDATRRSGDLEDALPGPTNSPPATSAEDVKRFCRVTGTTTASGAERILSQMTAMQVWGRNDTDEQRIRASVQLIKELGPTNATEALLCVQIFSVHEAALLFLQRATAEAQTFEGSDANVLRATRLMRLFNEQLEAMSKLKGKVGQQKVTVEHVHVHEGGQAIVGAVSTGKPDRGEGDR